MNKKIKRLVYTELIEGYKDYYNLFYENGVNVGTIYMEVDGYYVWQPDNSKGGCLSEYFLFAIAYTLLDMNKEYDKLVRNDINI